MHREHYKSLWKSLLDFLFKSDTLGRWKKASLNLRLKWTFLGTTFQTKKRIYPSLHHSIYILQWWGRGKGKAHKGMTSNVWAGAVIHTYLTFWVFECWCYSLWWIFIKVQERKKNIIQRFRWKDRKYFWIHYC